MRRCRPGRIACRHAQLTPHFRAGPPPRVRGPALPGVSHPHHPPFGGADPSAPVGSPSPFESPCDGPPADPTDRRGAGPPRRSHRRRPGCLPGAIRRRPVHPHRHHGHRPGADPRPSAWHRPLGLAAASERRPSQWHRPMPPVGRPVWAVRAASAEAPVPPQAGPSPLRGRQAPAGRSTPPLRLPPQADQPTPCRGGRGGRSTQASADVRGVCGRSGWPPRRRSGVQPCTRVGEVSRSAGGRCRGAR